LPTGLVRPVPVVMADVFAEDRSKVRFVVDQHPVGALGPRGAHPPLGIAIRARGPRRGLHYRYVASQVGPDLTRRASYALASKDLIEGSPGTLRVSKTLSPRCGCGRKACFAWRRPLSC